MRIFIDIDGVLAFCNVAVLVNVCNDVWSLGIEEERLAQIDELNDFKAMPEVIARREERGPEWFDRELAWMHFHPRVLGTDVVGVGAREGVRSLSQLGEVSYCTARYICDDEPGHERVVEATHRWLHTHQFDNAEHVVFCDRIAGKLHHLLDQVRESNDRLVLIDDNATRILAQIAEMSQANRESLRERLVLVAFASASPPIGDLHTLSLRRWRDIDLVVRSLEQGGHNAATL